MLSHLVRSLAEQLARQWAGLVALFLVLTTGAAYALAGSNTVFSDDIVDGQVTSLDVADESLTGSDARTLGNRDIAADALGTGRVAESSLGIVPVAAQAGSGFKGNGGCYESATYVTCGTAAVHLAKPGRVLIIADVWTSTSSFVQYYRGVCRLEVNGAPIEASETHFKYDDEGEATPLLEAREGAGQHATLTAVSHVYPTGRQVVGVECTIFAPGEALNGEDGEGNAFTEISAVALSDR